MNNSILNLQKAYDLMTKGKHNKAERVLKQLRREFPLWSEPTKLSGLNSLYQGQEVQALNFFKKLVSQSPDSADSYDLLGTALMQANKFEQARDIYQKALSISPQDARVYNNLGNALRKLHNFEEAKSAYESSLALRPNDNDTRLNYANILHYLKSYVEAESVYKALITENVDDPSVYVNLSSTLLFQHKIREALRVCDLGLGKFKNNVELLFSKGHLLGASEKLDESEKTLCQLLALDPQNGAALQALSIHYFLQGRWSEAWEAYEARFITGKVARRPFPYKMWEGQDLKGQKILVWGEQGVGDEIMFASMLPDLLRLGGDVHYETDPRLIPLLQRSFPEINFFEKNDPPLLNIQKASFEFQSPSGNLGRWLRKTELDFDKTEEFLVADPSRVAELKKNYKENGKTLVGVAWRSENPDIGKKKSLNLKQLNDLFKLSNIKFVDLQYGDTSRERRLLFKENGFNIFHDDEIDQLKSLDNFAAQVAAMDLIVSISNTTAHIAGALGVPVWVMLQKLPDRRWMMDRNDSPWYKSVRLFRQEKSNEWEPVVEKVVKQVSIFLRH